MVLELVNLDVFKDVNKWKEILTQIRSKIRIRMDNSNL
uniref:Four helix bundle protein n=1 Tax=Heterorhabditis bacteriophora TaxID=37862 RepID=A0A1I7WK52_HETBA